MLTEICPEISSCKPGHIKSARLPDFRSAILIGNNNNNASPPGFFRFEQILNATDSSKVNELRALKKTLQFNDPINIQYTSGTTGSPKGVVLSHHMIVNNANQLGEAQDYCSSRTRLCLPLPLYHCFGMVLGCLTTLIHGLTAVFPSPTFNAEECLKSIQREKCTTLFGTPTMFIDIYNHPNFDKYNVSSLSSGIGS